MNTSYRVLLVGLLVLALSATQAQAAPKPPPGKSKNPELAATIPSSPLTITVNDNTSISYQLDGREMFFGPSDSGTFLTIDNTVYGPEPLANQGFAPLAYTPVSNTLSGTGTGADPYTITTVVQAGATGITLTQTLTYIAGEQDYSLNFRLENIGAAKNVRLTHAADLYVNFPDNDVDFGYAFRDPLTGAIGSVTKTGQYIQAFLPNNTTPPTAYQISNWGREGEPLDPFWLFIGGSAGGAGAGLQNIVQQGYYDIVCGFQWDVTVPTGSPGKQLAAAGVTEVGMRGAFGTAADFNIRPFGAFLPLVSAP
jgi:hypothetical protein